MVQTFAAQVKAFADLSKEKMDFVVKQSAEDVFSIAQLPKQNGGRLPKDLGNLQNSFVCALNGSTSLSGADAYVATIAGYDLGDSIFGGWTAAYALRMEYGFVGADRLGRVYSQAGNFYALGAYQQWQRIVAMNAEKARAL